MTWEPRQAVFRPMPVLSSFLKIPFEINIPPQRLRLVLSLRVPESFENLKTRPKGLILLFVQCPLSYFVDFAVRYIVLVWAVCLILMFLAVFMLFSNFVCCPESTRVGRAINLNK